MPDWWTEGGSRPASRPTFFRKKVGKEPALLPTSLRFAAGNLRRQALEAVRPNSLRACGTPFRQTAASQSTKLLHSAVQQPAPRACRHRRGHKGQYQDSFFIKLIAAAAIQISTRAQFRHKSSRLSAPASTRVSAPAARCSGCGHWHRRVSMHRALTCRCLSERRAASAKRVGRHRSLNGVTQVCLERSET